VVQLDASGFDYGDGDATLTAALQDGTPVYGFQEEGLPMYQAPAPRWTEGGQ
jgi:hypothetical protein